MKSDLNFQSISNSDNEDANKINIQNSLTKGNLKIMENPNDELNRKKDRG